MGGSWAVISGLIWTTKGPVINWRAIFSRWKCPKVYLRWQCDGNLEHGAHAGTSHFFFAFLFSADGVCKENRSVKWWPTAQLRFWSWVMSGGWVNSRKRPAILTCQNSDFTFFYILFGYWCLLEFILCMSNEEWPCRLLGTKWILRGRNKTCTAHPQTLEKLKS